MEPISKSQERDEIVLECSIKLLDPLFNEVINFKKINLLLAVLKELRTLNPNLPTFLLQWILLPHEKRILKVEIVLKLVKEGFLLVKEFDKGFSTLLEVSNNNVHILSITKIIKSLIIDENYFPPSTFPKTIDYILKSIKVFKDMYPKLSKYLEDFKNAISQGSGSSAQSIPISFQPVLDNVYQNTVKAALALFDSDKSEDYDTAFAKLKEWFAIKSEEEMPNFIKMLGATIFQAQDNTLTKFFAFITDICVDFALKSTEKGTVERSLDPNSSNNAIDFSYIDAFSKLVTLIFKTVINADKKSILERILEASVLILTKNHELHQNAFNQRPFFRLYYNLIFVNLHDFTFFLIIIKDIQRKEYNFSADDQLLFTNIFTKVLDQLQPLSYPGFSFAWLQLLSTPGFISLNLTINVFFY